MTPRTGHASQRVGQRGGNRKNQKHFEEVGEWGGILKGMRAVGVEKSATVGPKHFYDFLGGCWAEGDGLLGNDLRPGLTVRTLCLHLLRFDQLRLRIGLEVLDDALRDKHQRTN